jgi:type III pantothenate kinase
MTFALDVGSTRIFGGLIQDGCVLASFHKNTSIGLTSDELGLFLVQWLETRGYLKEDIGLLVYCSVVPELNRVLEECGRIYLEREALTLRAGVKSGLQVKYTNHQDLGADLIANAVGAVDCHPGRNLIIVDFGTATSLCAVSKDKEYLGGTLIPGLIIAMEALADRTARLPVVEIGPVGRVCSRDTASAIQGGLFYGTLGMLKELIKRLNRECFPDESVLVIATGEQARLFEKFQLFDHIIPELVLLGLDRIRHLNS